MEVLILDDGTSLLAFDCRDILDIEEVPPSDGSLRGGCFLVRMGRLGASRRLLCRDIVGIRPLSPADIRPVPPVLLERIEGPAPWAVGMTEHGLCLLY